MSEIVTCEESVLNGDEIDLLVRANPKVPKLRDPNGNENGVLLDGDEDEHKPEPEVTLTLSEELMIAEAVVAKEKGQEDGQGHGHSRSKSKSKSKKKGFSGVEASNDMETTGLESTAVTPLAPAAADDTFSENQSPKVEDPMQE
jgi:hypothetical protein